jgi:hypothetical protein
MNILEKILAQKKLEIAALDASTLRRAAESSPAPRDFLAAIQRRRDATSPKLIAELKRASPSKGILAPHLDLFQVADIYAQNGAAAVSVLTDEKFFMGNLETLRGIRNLQLSTFNLQPATGAASTTSPTPPNSTNGSAVNFPKAQASLLIPFPADISSRSCPPLSCLQDWA